MISFDFLREIAIKQQTSLLNLAREYAQLVFLAKFYQLEDSEKIFFKGGTCLRLVHNSPRFSEDLDFSAISLRRCQQYEDLLETALTSLEQEGFSVEIDESKSTSGGCLAIFKLEAEDTKFFLRTDVSLRQGTGIKGEVTLINGKLYPAFTAFVLTPDSLVEEKISALLRRQAGRDFYDCYYLIRRRMGLKIIAKKRNKILQLLKRQNNSTFKELEPFLPLSQKPLVQNFKQLLRSELERM